MAGETGGGGGRGKAREAKSSATGLEALGAGWEGQRDCWLGRRSAQTVIEGAAR